jgi:hypothetical protein
VGRIDRQLPRGGDRLMSERIRLSGITVNAPDAIELAKFYAEITGGVAKGGARWAVAVGPNSFIAFQGVELRVRRPGRPSVLPVHLGRPTAGPRSLRGVKVIQPAPTAPLRPRRSDRAAPTAPTTPRQRSSNTRRPARTSAHRQRMADVPLMEPSWDRRWPRQPRRHGPSSRSQPCPRRQC